MPVCGSGVLVCSLVLLIRGPILPAVRQKLHLSPCADSRTRLFECRLTDRFGSDWAFIEKSAVVSSTSLHNNSTYPQSGLIGCSVISAGLDDNSHEFAVVDTEQPWGICAINGSTRFEVFADQLERV